MSEGQKEKQSNILENVSSILEDVTEDIGKNIDSISKNVSEQMDSNKEQLKKLFNMNSNSGNNEGGDNKNDDDSGGNENIKDVGDDKDSGEDDDKDSGEDEEEESESEDDDEEKLQKFDVNMTNNIITNSHPESILHNNDEVQKMTYVSRDDNGIIIDKLHKTIPIMTKFEKTKILGERCKQLQSGSEPFIDIDEDGYLDEYLIATRELEAKKIPFIIRRPLPNGGSEYWDIRDLEILY